MTARILVSDPIAQDGIEVLEQSGFEVDVRTGLPPEALREAVADYDAMIVRSETKVTAEVIQAAPRLQVVGRAGIGADNIDLDAATERGVVVVNAPTGNVISAAEHAIGLMFALSRNIAQADASIRSGRWDRSKFIGVELRGKTLGIIGLGQVGAEVARRCRGLEMRVIAHDPFVPEERARVLGVELMSLEDLLRESDFVTLHIALSKGTTSLIGQKELRLMKPSARIINASRGGVVDEVALYQAIEEGRLDGAALDVFSQEPLPADHKLLTSNKIIVTPHLGASTAEAQEKVAVDVAAQVIAILRGQPALHAVNAPLIPPETYSVLGPYLAVAEKAGSLARQLCEGQVREVEIDYSGEIGSHDVTPLRAAVVKGLLEQISEEHVNIVNVDLIAKRRGLRITEKLGPIHEIYSNLISVRVSTSVGETAVSATLAHDGPHIVLINDFWVDIPPIGGYLLTCENEDKPGMIGAIGTTIGGFAVNISFMNVGRRDAHHRALMVLLLDDTLSPDQLTEIREIPNIFSARLARL